MGVVVALSAVVVITHNQISGQVDSAISQRLSAAGAPGVRVSTTEGASSNELASVSVLNSSGGSSQVSGGEIAKVAMSEGSQVAGSSSSSSTAKSHSSSVGLGSRPAHQSAQPGDTHSVASSSTAANAATAAAHAHPSLWQTLKVLAASVEIRCLTIMSLAQVRCVWWQLSIQQLGL